MMRMDTTSIAWPVEFTGVEKAMVVQGAKWSQVAYSMSDVDATACDAHCRLFQDGDDTLVIAVRGTTSVVDAMCDIEVNMTPLSDGSDMMVHAGFHRQFLALKDGMDARVTGHLQRGGHLMCTGHSLGAGVASLFAVFYATAFPGKQVSFCGYGTPRSGNAAFARAMATDTRLAVCVRNNRDPVCASIPPVASYCHVGREITIGWDPFPDVPDLTRVRDHDIALYVSHLEAPPRAQEVGRRGLRSCSTM